MRVLLSTIGSRGDVQPLVALAVELKGLGHDVRLCVPPDFREWIAGLGLPVTSIGPELRSTAKPKAAPAAPISPELRRQMIEGTVAAQFETITAAAEGCDLIVGATALQVAAPSVAEHMGIPYVFAAYCPAVLPSPRHAPPVLGVLGDKPTPAMDDYSELWAADARRWNDTWGTLINSRRTSLGLPAVSDVHRYVITDRPWLAADHTLGPWPGPANGAVFQTGAWILPDESPLLPELEAFLDAGDPPVYFGFGSIRAPEQLSRAMIESARALGRRAILYRGWADLSLIDDAPDCLTIGDVNQQALFTRVAAVVHHGLDLIQPGERYSAGRFARSAAAWGEALGGRAGLPVVFVDERLSSFDAEQAIIERKRGGEKITRKRKKEQLDALAAAGFLQAFLDGRLAAIVPGGVAGG